MTDLAGDHFATVKRQLYKTTVTGRLKNILYGSEEYSPQNALTDKRHAEIIFRFIELAPRRLLAHGLLSSRYDVLLGYPQSYD